MMEYSSTRKPLSSNLLVKNFLQFSLVICFFWFLGFGFSGLPTGNTSSKFIGENQFGGEDWLTNDVGISFSYLVTTCTFIVFIINNAISEKTEYTAYVLFSICLSIFVWPVVVAWTYGRGWLIISMPDSMIETGSVVVYTFAGTMAVVAAVLTGRRPGRFGADRKKYAIQSHEIYVLGCFLTVLGCFGINYFFSSYGTYHGGIGMATVWICGSVSSIVSLKLLTIVDIDTDTHYIAVYQGFIAGMVFITSVSQNITPWESGLLGLMSGCVFATGVWVFRCLQLDDVLNMGPTFLFPGIFGGVLPGFEDHNYGLYWGGQGQTLGANVVGTVTIFLWALFWGIAIFGAMKILRLLNLSDAVVECGGAKHIELTQRGYIVTPDPSLNYHR